MADQNVSDRVRRLGLVAGPALAAAVLAGPRPEALTPAAAAAAAVCLLMATWWMTEAMPLPITALVPLAAFPLLGVAGIDTTARAFAHPLVFLFLGGFILAKALERWRLHLRLAQALSRGDGTSVGCEIAGLMAVTAFLSMWVSNTATAMVMLPVAKAMADQMRGGDETGLARVSGDIGAPVMLAVAYAATIGGMASLIGTPPNALFAAYMQTAHGINIGFAQWLAVGLPTSIVLLLITYVLLTRILYRLPDRVEPPPPPDENGRQPLSGSQRATIAILFVTAAAWVLQPVIAKTLPWLALSDAGIAIIGAIALFIVPSRETSSGVLLDWKDVAGIRWDVLILVGGGLALADGISTSGLARWIGASLGGLTHLPVTVLLLAIMFAVVFIGELASNTAIAAIFLPVTGALAIAMGTSPLAFAMPVALAASLGFMLPVATPPNAIVYGSRLVSGAAMMKAGFILNIVATLVVAAIALSWGRLILPG